MSVFKSGKLVEWRRYPCYPPRSTRPAYLLWHRPCSWWARIFGKEVSRQPSGVLIWIPPFCFIILHAASTMSILQHWNKQGKGEYIYVYISSSFCNLGGTSLGIYLSMILFMSLSWQSKRQWGSSKWLVLGIFGGHQGCYDIFYLGKLMSMLILSNKYQGLKPIHQSTRHSWRHLALHFGGDANDLKNETSFPNQSISAAPCSIHMRHHWCCSPLEKTRSEMEMDQRQPQLQVWHSFCSSIHEWNQIWNLGRKGVDLNFDWSTQEWSCGMNDGG